MSDVLYHYCSTQTFHALFSAPKPGLRLSSLSLSNDAMEGVWIKKIFNELCVEEGLSSKDVTAASSFLDGLLANVDGLGFCLSKEADMLSQWRGYADDGNGFCIGFPKSYLEGLRVLSSNNLVSTKLESVIYDRGEQFALLKPMVKQVSAAIAKGAFRPAAARMILDSRTDEEIAQENATARRAVSELGAALFDAYFLMFRLKNHAFREEQEWRMLTLVNTEGEGIQYHPRGDRLVPYTTLSFGDLNGAVEEVIIGPKNITPIPVITGFLKEHGFGGVKVRKSDASYR